VVNEVNELPHNAPHIRLGLPNPPITMTKYEQSFITNFTRNDLPVHEIHVAAAYSRRFSVTHASLQIKNLH
jgi:hypothetical protein